MIFGNPTLVSEPLLEQLGLLIACLIVIDVN
jgi:hypothetical protein